MCGEHQAHSSFSGSSHSLIAPTPTLLWPPPMDWWDDQGNGGEVSLIYGIDPNFTLLGLTQYSGNIDIVTHGLFFLKTLLLTMWRAAEGTIVRAQEKPGLADVGRLS